MHMKDMIKPPYYAVIFKSKINEEDNGYAKMAKALVMEAEKQHGFLGADSVRAADGTGITVSYWVSMESIDNWKRHALHIKAKELGKHIWYESYSIQICRVESDNWFPF